VTTLHNIQQTVSIYEEFIYKFFIYLLTMITENENILCDKCGYFFTFEEFDTHFKKNHTDVVCSTCNFICENSKAYFNHLSICNKSKKLIKCPYCQKRLTSIKSLKYHFDLNECVNQQGGQLPELNNESVFKVQKSAFKKFIEEYYYEPEDIYNDANEFFLSYQKEFKSLYKTILTTVNNVKTQICLTVNFHREIDGQLLNQIGYFMSLTRPLSNIKNFNKIFYKSITEIENKINEFTERGSGWIIESINKVEIRVGIYKPLAGNCHVELPYGLKKKQAVLDLKNDDEYCFLYAVIAGLFTFKNQRQKYTVKYYKNYIKNFNLKNIEFPMKIKEISKFEKQNQHLNLCINLYEWSDNGNEIKPLQISKRNGTTINILYYKNHYSYIINFNRLCGFMGSEYHHFCHRCLAGFKTEKRKIDHLENCQLFKPTKVILPEESNNILKFRDYSLTMKYDYIGYADFEAVLVKKEENKTNKTKTTHIHKPCGYSLIIVDYKGEIYFQDIYRGVDAAEKFLNVLAYKSADIFNELKIIKPMIISDEQQNEFDSVTVCYLCEKPFEDDQIKTRDHCHRSGLFRGAAHVDCNLSYKVRKELPLFLHNLKNYDSNIIIKALSNEQFKSCKIIPSTMEKFVSFNLSNNENMGTIKFLDSYNFMSSSLATLTENLANIGQTEFKTTRKVFQSLFPNIINDSSFELLLRKGIYPYEWVDDFNKFNELELPDKSQFYSSLKLEGITDQDYEHALRVWRTFNCQNFGMYHDLYLLLDTCLLCDVFEKFRQVCFNNYGLEAAAFYSVPGLSFAAALKYTNVELELLTDIEMLNFFEKSIRGGVCQTSKRFARANNKYNDDYNSENPSNYIFYVDVNNLYGTAMSSHMPISNFRWLTQEDINKLEKHGFENINDEGEYGYVIECDLSYPDYLHESHNEFPLAPTKMKINNEELSEYQHELIDMLKIAGHKRVKSEKLMLTLYDKEKYILHYRNLKLYLNLGLKLEKIHRILSFKQSKWLKPFIDMNTNLRKQSKNWIKKPQFETFNIIDDNKAIIKLQKNKIKLNKPIYIGFTVLEYAKLIMYNYHYNVFKKIYGNNIQLLYHDTDSFIYEIKTEDLYKDLEEEELNFYFDFSNYEKDDALYDDSKKKSLGFIKDETNGRPIIEFVGLKSKMYSVLLKDENKKRAKGLQTAILKKYVTHDDYKQTLENSLIYADTKRIQSINHQLKTIKTNKLIYSPFCDKRYIKNDKITSLAFGHKDC
jgi:hypothetical protein